MEKEDIGVDYPVRPQDLTREAARAMLLGIWGDDAGKDDLKEKCLDLVWQARELVRN
jgi:hypothetical protein